MDATTLFLGNGLTRTVQGTAEDVGNVLKKRTLSADDGLRQFVTTDGDTLTVNASAVVLVEAAPKTTANKGTFGFGRVLDEEAA